MVKDNGLVWNTEVGNGYYSVERPYRKREIGRILQDYVVVRNTLERETRRKDEGRKELLESLKTYGFKC